MQKLNTHYCKEDDMTFITEDSYDDFGLVSQEVVGFYYGEPNPKSTGLYYRSYKATFNEEKED
jgi:hypothetical protein